MLSQRAGAEGGGGKASGVAPRSLTVAARSTGTIVDSRRYNPQNWRHATPNPFVRQRITTVIAPRVLPTLVAAFVVLPMVALVLGAIGRLLLAMGDAGGAVVLNRLALAGGVLWAIDLALLVLLLGLRALEPRE